MLSNNLLKGQFAAPSQESRRVISADELLVKRQREEEARAEFLAREGFQAGLAAEVIEVEEGGEDSESGNVIKAKPELTPEELLEDAQARANSLLQSAGEEADALRTKAREELEAERESALEQAREQGYREGSRRAEQENESARRELEQREKELEREYQDAAEQLEVKLVEAITGVYEHIFRVDLSENREILIHLVGAAMRRAEGSKEFLVRVSGEDYAYVNMQKKSLQAAATASGGTLEVVEDSTLSRNQCMIETETGILDCGLDTQLTELTKKLRLLSYDGK